ncbi:HAD-IIIA family hydrolase [Spirobacillus cienkowskii]|uniref:HAD-IIIA family hydrolase n=1 Tax=Spirobacillus cienkowskii TaxID=495820 RepID=UPI0030D34D02
MKQAVILAGGKGSRIWKIADGLPKALMLINGKPLIHYQIELLKKYGITEIIVLTGFLAEKIESNIKDGAHMAVSVIYKTEAEPLGTAGSLLSAYELLDHTFLVLYSDVFLSVNLKYFIDFHIEKNADVSIFVHPNSHPHDSDILEVDDDNKVTNIHSYPRSEKMVLPNLVNAALYIVKKHSLEKFIQPIYKSDICKDLFPKFLFNNIKLFAYNSPEYIKDMGTPERYKQVEEDIKYCLHLNKSFSLKNSAIFLDRDGTLNEHKGHIINQDQLTLIPNVPSAIKKINKSKYLAILATNQPVIAKGMCSEEELKKIHWKLETLLGKEGAYLDRIYFCPHHPDKGFKGEIAEYKIRCNCRKPETGMLEKAVKDLNIEKNKSWFIGDTTVDIECAKRMKIKSVLVRTGEKGEDYRFPAKADFEFYSLDEAVNFIVNDYEIINERLLPIIQDFNQSCVILIGGQSRSGKSTIASLIKNLLLENNKESSIINLDNWLISEQDRNLSEGLYGRYNFEEIKNIIDKIVNRSSDIVIEAPIYNRSHSSIVKDMTQKIEVKKNDIVIFEGIIALMLKDDFKNSEFKIYIDTPEESRKERIKKEYLLRGRTEKQFLDIYSQRIIDEYVIIEKYKNVADKIITLGDHLNYDYCKNST